MRNKTRFAATLAGLAGLVSLTLTAQAQGSIGNPPNPVPLFFAMPTGVDPVQLYLFNSGFAYTTTNDPFINANGTITGATLRGGLEIHGRLNIGGIPAPVAELELSTSYLGPINLKPVADPNFINGQTNAPYNPWQVTDLGIQNNEQTFVLTPQRNSAPMDINGFYGVFYTPVGADNSDFQQADFSVTGLTDLSLTPEPPSGRLLLGGLVTVGLLGLLLRKPWKAGHGDLGNQPDTQGNL